MKFASIRAFLLATLWLTCLANAPRATATEPGGSRVLWDSYGVPHVYAKDTASAFHGFGWSQAHSHGNLLLRLYGESRGRASEYWGGQYEDGDRWVLANDIPARSKAWYDDQEAEFRNNLDAFAQGINDYLDSHPDAVDPALKQTLPITGVDVIAHAHKLFHFTYVISPNKVFQGSLRSAAGASNAWAVAPSRTRDGHALLLANPHLTWNEGSFRYYEAHLIAPGVDVYGATQVGLPVMRFAFNPDIGYTHTVNATVGYTLFELETEGEGYRYDGEVLPFSRRDVEYKVRREDGSLQSKSMPVRSTLHGTVFERDDGKTIAVRVAGLDRHGALQQYWEMSTARSLAEFERALRRMQVPLFNIVYADRAGHVMYLNNGVIPKHADGDLDYWRSLVPGNTSSTLWTEVHDYEDLPRVIDPDGGFVQNANDPPWNSTWPQVLHASRFPAYMAAPGPYSLRAQQSLAILRDTPRLDFETMVHLKTSTRSLMADRVLPDLLPAAQTDSREQVRLAAQVLAAWDRNNDAGSRGALLFERWARRFSGPEFNDDSRYARRWSATDPLQSPAGIASIPDALDMLDEAARETVAMYGALDRPFGEVSRFRLGDTDLPGSGGFGNTGSFHTITWSDLADGTRTPKHGETWVSIVEFSTPVRAVGLMSYGNSSQAGSPHRDDQLPHLSAKTYRTLWLTREQVEENLSSIDDLTEPTSPRTTRTLR